MRRLALSISILALSATALPARAELEARELRMDIPFVYRLKYAIQDAFQGRYVTDEQLVAPLSRIRMIFMAEGPKGFTGSTQSSEELRRDAKQISQYAYTYIRTQPENFVAHSEALVRLAALHSDLDDHSTVIGSRDEIVQRDSPYGYLGTLKATYLTPEMADTVFRRFGTAPEKVIYPESLEPGESYPIWNPLKGERDLFAIAGEESYGPPMKLSQITGIRDDSFPAMLLAAAVDLSRRAQAPGFKPPRGFVLECPEDKISFYHKLGFRLLAGRPSAEGSYLMGLGPKGFDGIGVPHSHRPIASQLRDEGFKLHGFYGEVEGVKASGLTHRWVRDNRTTFKERIRHRYERTLRKLHLAPRSKR